MSDEARLERIEEHQIEMMEQLAVVIVEVKRTNGSVAKVLRELGGVHPEGPGPGRSIRDRLHKIENDKAAAALVAEALTQAQKKKAEADIVAAGVKESANRRHFAYLGAAVAVFTVASPWIRSLIHILFHH